MKAPKLNDSKWQVALDEVVPRLAKFQERLNAISDDIRTLEKTLTESGFRIYTSINLSSGEILAWTEIGSSWRISFLQQGDSDGEFVVRPLIETPAAVRWHVAHEVPRLLREIAVVAAANEPPITDDDFPF